MAEQRHKYSIWLSLEEREAVRKLEELSRMSFSSICRKLLIEKARVEGFL